MFHFVLFHMGDGRKQYVRTYARTFLRIASAIQNRPKETRRTNYFSLFSRSLSCAWAAFCRRQSRGAIDNSVSGVWVQTNRLGSQHANNID